MKKGKKEWGVRAVKGGSWKKWGAYSRTHHILQGEQKAKPSNEGRQAIPGGEESPPKKKKAQVILGKRGKRGQGLISRVFGGGGGEKHLTTPMG